MFRYTTILFDFDHTLLDSTTSEVAAFELTMQSVGLTDAAAHFATYQRINQVLWAGVERGETSPNAVAVERFRQFTAEVGVDADPEAMAVTFRTGLGANGDLYPGARAMLETLAEHTTLGMVTNGIGQVQRDRIERLGLDAYFSSIAISGELGVAKPNPTIFDHAFADLPGADRAATVMVGDSLSSDIAGGANAGLDTVWVNRLGVETDLDHHEAHGITHEVTSLADLLSKLRR